MKRMFAASICGAILAVAPIFPATHGSGDTPLVLAPGAAYADPFAERQIRRQLKKLGREATRKAGFRVNLPKGCVKAAEKAKGKTYWKCGEDLYRGATKNGKEGYVPVDP